MVCQDDPTGPDPCNVIDPNFGDTPCNIDSDCVLADPATSVVAVNDRCDMTQHRCVQTACSKNIYIGDQCRPVDPVTKQIQTDRPVDPTTTKCAPLEINGLYRVAVNNYIAAGGSGFLVLKRNTSQQDTGVSLRAALTVFLSNAMQPITPMCTTGRCCDNVPTTAIPDTTDTQTPQRSIQQRWGNVSCLDDTFEAHDGRIRPVTE